MEIEMDEYCRCQEASFLSRETYIPCGAPAVGLMWSLKDHRAYLMCESCINHNLRRGMVLVARRKA